MPDLEDICNAYLTARQRGSHDEADFVVLELLDQCVRTTSGGEMGRKFSELENASTPNQKHLQDFIINRTGTQTELATTIGEAGGIWRRLVNIFDKIKGKLANIYIRTVIRLLPSAFRHQNVSLAAVGERHAWVYDFYTLKVLLKDAGFTDITRSSAATSGIEGFPHHPLDVDSRGHPRKGSESMYVEARKP